jgi:FkbM family methyltransferase
MEGNDCYKFSTIRRYLERTGGAPVRVALDIGANVGAISLLMRSYFPHASIYAFEAVSELADVARAHVSRKHGIRLFRRAVTSEHVFKDDLGRRRRHTQARLHILRGTPAAGPGWLGGSVVLPEDNPSVSSASPPAGYLPDAQRVRPITLDRVVELVLAREHVRDIDIVKLDCEGCEHSSLGGARLSTLRRLRYVVGEYHGIQRFASVMRGKLFRTHKVSLIGDRDLGAFFAERRSGEEDGILLHRNEGMLVSRPWLGDDPIEWHLFDEAHVATEERAVHALPSLPH